MDRIAHPSFHRWGNRYEGWLTPPWWTFLFTIFFSQKVSIPDCQNHELNFTNVLKLYILQKFNVLTHQYWKGFLNLHVWIGLSPQNPCPWMGCSYGIKCSIFTVFSFAENKSFCPPECLFQLLGTATSPLRSCHQLKCLCFCWCWFVNHQCEKICSITRQRTSLTGPSTSTGNW